VSKKLGIREQLFANLTYLHYLAKLINVEIACCHSAPRPTRYTSFAWHLQSFLSICGFLRLFVLKFR